MSPFVSRFANFKCTIWMCSWETVNVYKTAFYILLYQIVFLKNNIYKAIYHKIYIKILKWSYDLKIIWSFQFISKNLINVPYKMESSMWSNKEINSFKLHQPVKNKRLTDPPTFAMRNMLFDSYKLFKN